MISVTTDAVPGRDRAEFWADLVSRHVTPIQIQPAGALPLRGEIRARSIGGVEVAQVAGMGVQALHTRAHVAQAHDHLYAVCVHVEGEARLIDRGETVALRPGDVFITDSRREFTFDLQRPWRHLVVTVPTSWVDARMARPGSISAVEARDHPLARLWASHLATGVALADQLSPAAAALFARQSLDLLAQLFDESQCERRSPSEASRHAIFATACQVIAIAFGDHDLTPAAIARHLGVSVRALERAFAANGETVMRRVYDERVRQAARLLTAPEAAHRSITSIAFACGFNDLSHFGRAFAARMQMTPSEWRRRMG